MKIAYYPAGQRAFASSRLRVWKIAEELEKLGHEVWMYPEFVGRAYSLDVSIFQKRFDLLDLMEIHRHKGARIIFDVDDLMQNIPFDRVDVVTTDTPYKRDFWQRDNVVVVPDALDVDADAARKTVHADVLRRVVWAGNPENMYHLQHVAEACKRLNLDLTVITDIGSPSYAHFDGVTGLSWDVETIDAEMIKADVAVCPFVFDGVWSQEWVASKSANKVFKAFALGLPVIGTPIPSYVDAGLQYCALTTDEWVTALEALRDPVARERDAERGRVIAEQYTADKVALKWLEVFQR